MWKQLIQTLPVIGKRHENVAVIFKEFRNAGDRNTQPVGHHGQSFAHCLGVVGAEQSHDILELFTGRVAAENLGHQRSGEIRHISAEGFNLGGRERQCRTIGNGDFIRTQ